MITAAGILDGVARTFHAGSDWVFFRELRTGTGWGRGMEQRLDGWAIGLWPSKNLCSRVAYEVKVNRQDFLKEIKRPIKRRLALLYSNHFYFAAPSGLISPLELPPEAGLVEVDSSGIARRIILAPFRDSLPPPWRFVASIARRSAVVVTEVVGVPASLVGGP